MTGKASGPSSTSKSTSSIFLDLKSLPIEVYKHLRGQKLPSYQWTAIDPVIRSRFLACSYEKSFTTRLAFLLLVHLWLGAFGFFHTL